MVLLEMMTHLAQTDEIAWKEMRTREEDWTTVEMRRLTSRQTQTRRDLESDEAVPISKSFY